MEPINNRIFFAGEAVHERLWGTVGGAWESGERAAAGGAAPDRAAAAGAEAATEIQAATKATPPGMR